MYTLVLEELERQYKEQTGQKAGKFDNEEVCLMWH